MNRKGTQSVAIDLKNVEHFTVLQSLAFTGNGDALAMYNARHCYQRPIPMPEWFEDALPIGRRRRRMRNLRQTALWKMETARVPKCTPHAFMPAGKHEPDEVRQMRIKQKIKGSSTFDLIMCVLWRVFG